MGTALIVGGLLAAASAGAQMYGSHQQSKASRKASRQQKEASDRAYQQQVSEMRRQNQQQANMDGILAQNTGADTPSTLLTGAGGISTDQMSLGKGSSLLGG